MWYDDWSVILGGRGVIIIGILGLVWVRIGSNSIDRKMQSLSLSMSLRSGSAANLLLLGSEARVRRRSRSVIVACASEGDSGSSSTSSFLSRTQTYALLKQQLQVAAKSEVSSV